MSVFISLTTVISVHKAIWPALFCTSVALFRVPIRGKTVVLFLVPLRRKRSSSFSSQWQGKCRPLSLPIDRENSLPLSRPIDRENSRPLSRPIDRENSRPLSRPTSRLLAWPALRSGPGTCVIRPSTQKRLRRVQFNLAGLAERLHKDRWSGSDATFQDGGCRLTNGPLLELATVVSGSQINWLRLTGGRWVLCG